MVPSCHVFILEANNLFSKKVPWCHLNKVSLLSSHALLMSSSLSLSIVIRFGLTPKRHTRVFDPNHEQWWWREEKIKSIPQAPSKRNLQRPCQEISWQEPRFRSWRAAFFVFFYSAAVVRWIPAKYLLDWWWLCCDDYGYALLLLLRLLLISTRRIEAPIRLCSSRPRCFLCTFKSMPSGALEIHRQMVHPKNFFFAHQRSSFTW